MSDDKTKKDYHDRTRINLGEPHEVAYWTKRFNISSTGLQKIIAEVGPMVADVEKQLAEIKEAKK